MKTESPPLNLPQFARAALEAAKPPLRDPGDAAVLCWGKAALDTAKELARLSRAAHARRSKRRARKLPALVIAPAAAKPSGLGDPRREWRVIQGEHPLPGRGSFGAGCELLAFFDELGRQGVRRLEVHLSGGASSLAWVPARGLTAREIRARLEALYRAPLPIARLNAERARLCALKGGGAAKLLRERSPLTRARVHVTSDVLPYGLGVVGSGPFWDGRTRHLRVMDGERWLRAMARIARARGVRVLGCEPGIVESVERWAERVEREIVGIRKRELTHASGIRLWGGEPLVDLKPGLKLGRAPRLGRDVQARRTERKRRGGRLTHLAALLLRRWADRIARGEIEILCQSSDGSDGASRSSAAYLTAPVARQALRQPARLDRSIRELDTASLLEKWGALLPSRHTGTNVQDAVILYFK
jgi:hydroxypyruvate reductase